MRRDGFTLIEVVVALGILAAIAITGSKASMMYMNYVGRSETMQLAHTLAQNTRHEIVMANVIPASAERRVEFANQPWRVRITVSAVASTSLMDGVGLGLSDTMPKQVLVDVYADDDRLLASSQLVMTSVVMGATP